MILAFKPQFVEPIQNGTKIHTIIEDVHGRWKAGNSIQAATGVRTPNYNCFFESQCTGVQDVFMTYAYNDLIQISVDGVELFGYQERMELVKKDGFETWEEFFNWFYPLIMKNPKKEFSGRIIDWTDYRYQAAY